MGELQAGVAGASAQREYERRKSSRDERVRNRFGKRVGDALLAVAGEPQSVSAWKRGAEGERELADRDTQRVPRRGARRDAINQDAAEGRRCPGTCRLFALLAKAFPPN